MRLTTNGGVSPAFSRDGTRIAFTAPPESTGFGATGVGGGVYIMGRTGDDVRQLTDFGYNPAWSPDGTKIAFGVEFVALNPYARHRFGYDLQIVDICLLYTSDAADEVDRLDFGGAL